MNKEQTENKKLSKETILNDSPMNKTENKNNITDITDITYLKKTITLISSNSKDSLRTTIYLARLLRDSCFAFARLTGKSFSQLVADSLAEYILNHKGELNVENFTLNVLQVDKKDKVQKEKEKADKEELKQLEKEIAEDEKEMRQWKRYIESHTR